jgi:hypothetical protein
MTERRTPQEKDAKNYSRPQGAQQLLDQSRHAGKSDVSKPAVGVTPHPEKATYDQACGKSGLSNPESGPRDRGKDPANMSKPHGGDEAIPRENLHLGKKKVEPQGAKNSPYPDGKTSYAGE